MRTACTVNAGFPSIVTQL